MVILVIKFLPDIENLFIGKQDLVECFFRTLLATFCTFHNVFFVLCLMVAVDYLRTNANHHKLVNHE